MATLLLHGFTGSSQSWGDLIIDGLSAVVGPPLLFDLPGHGRHAGERAPGRFTLDAVEEEIDGFVGAEPVDVVGYSMGGRVALAYAVRNPGRVRRLVLESASPGLATEEERAARCASDEELAVRLEDHGLESFIDGWERLPLFESQLDLPSQVREAHRAARLRNDAGSLATSLRTMGTGHLASLWGLLPALRVPVLVVVGERDEKFTAIGRQMREAIPDSAMVVIPDAGHATHLERPAAWLAAVAPFLAQGGQHE